MTSYWSVVSDDDLRMADKVVEFLQGEFCPAGADPMWSTDYFKWKLGSTNPAGKGYISIAVLQDRVVGTVSLTKKRLLIDGNECIGGEVQDAYSASALRRKGRFINLSKNYSDPNSYINKSIFGRLTSEVRKRADAGGISVIYATPANQNSYSYPGFVKKLGFFDYSGFQLGSFSRPTLMSVSRKYPSLSFLNAPLQKLETCWILLQQSSYNRGLCKRFTSDISVPSANELDELWSRLKPVKGFSLVRDASYWRHRYLEHPIAQYNFFTIREKGNLVGVVVTRLFLVSDGKRVVSIAEWMNEECIPFSYVLSIVINYYGGSGVESFNLWAKKFTEESRFAIRTLFVPRCRVPIVFADTPQGRSLQSMAANFKFYLGSSDNV